MNIISSISFFKILYYTTYYSYFHDYNFNFSCFIYRYNIATYLFSRWQRKNSNNYTPLLYLHNCFKFASKCNKCPESKYQPRYYTAARKCCCGQLDLEVFLNLLNTKILWVFDTRPCFISIWSSKDNGTFHFHGQFVHVCIVCEESYGVSK